MSLKKFLALSLVLALAAGTVFAGGGAAKDDSGGVTTIRCWTNSAHNKIEFDALVEKFNKGIGAQKGIKVEYTVYGADWNQVINMALSSGREPEMFNAFAEIPQFYQEGKILPWKEIPGIDDVLKAQEPYHVREATTFDGDVYSVSMFGWYTGFHYNKSLLQRAGYSAPPKTWAEFADASIKISKLEPGKIFGYAIPLTWTGFTGYMGEFAAAPSTGHVFYNHVAGKYQFADFAPYYEMLRQISEAGAMFPGLDALTDDQMRAQFAEGNIGFIMGGGWNVGVLYDQFPFKNPATGQPDPNGWDYAPLPVRDTSVTYGVPVSVGAEFFVSSQVRKDPAKLNKMGDVIRLFCGDEIQSVLYTAGKNMPLRPDIIAKAAPPARAQWASLGKSTPRLVALPAMPHNFLALEGPTFNTILSQVVSGQARDIKAALEDLDKRYNAAFEQAVQRGIIKRENYVEPSLDARFKAK